MYVLDFILEMKMLFSANLSRLLTSDATNFKEPCLISKKLSQGNFV